MLQLRPLANVRVKPPSKPCVLFVTFEKFDQWEAVARIRALAAKPTARNRSDQPDRIGTLSIDSATKAGERNTEHRRNPNPERLSGQMSWTINCRYPLEGHTLHFPVSNCIGAPRAAVLLGRLALCDGGSPDDGALKVPRSAAHPMPRRWGKTCNHAGVDCAAGPLTPLAAPRDGRVRGWLWAARSSDTGRGRPKLRKTGAARARSSSGSLTGGGAGRPRPPRATETRGAAPPPSERPRRTGGPPPSAPRTPAPTHTHTNL